MDERRPLVLAADDQEDVLEALRLLLKREGYDLVAASSPAEVLAAVEKHAVDVVLIDLNYANDTTSGTEGLNLLADLKRLDAALPVVVMTAWASIELAVEAIRRGAGDFVEKPWENPRLLNVLRTQLELGRAVRRSERLETALSAGHSPQIVAESTAMRTVLDLVRRVAPSEASVLITGENGTGKTLVARALHASSERAERPLVTVDVGGLAASVFESELFGHVRGAFTDAKQDRAGRFELADGGTLFLDEVGNVPLAQQPKLLRVVETGEFERLGSSKTRQVDVRVLSATNADLDAALAEGRFRQDLLYRLKTVEIRLPPLRERLDDIEPLATSFLGRYATRYGRTISGFESSAVADLCRYPWPGNVRELEHAVERAVLLARGDRVTTSDLGLSEARSAGEPTGLAGLTLDEAERLLVRSALERHGGNVSRAAEELGLSRSALYRRLDKHDLG